MSERQKCCRLCLAPDSECISILNSYAADKEPLTTKIFNCVHIKISITDRLSLRICHACISYLNSWQSFKNRCIASHNKQLIWLDNEKQDISFGGQQQEQTSTSATTASNNNDELNDHQQQHQQQREIDLATSLLDGITSLKKRKSLTVYVSPKQQYQQQQIKQLQLQQQQQQRKQSDTIFKTDFKPIKPKRQYIRHIKATPPASTSTSTSSSSAATSSMLPLPAFPMPIQTPKPIKPPRSPRKTQKQLRELLEQPKVVIATTATTAAASAIAVAPATAALSTFASALTEQTAQAPTFDAVVNQMNFMQSQASNFALLSPAAASLPALATFQPPLASVAAAATATPTSSTATLTSTSTANLFVTASSTTSTETITNAINLMNFTTTKTTTTTTMTTTTTTTITTTIATTTCTSTASTALEMTMTTPASIPFATTLSSSALAAALASPSPSSNFSQCSTQELRLFRRYSSYNPLPAVQIKDEPYDSDEIDGRSQQHSHNQLQQQNQHDDCDDIVDPTMFLERTEEEGDEPLDGSLYGYASQQKPVPPSSSSLSSSLQIRRSNQPSLVDPVKQASCRACNLKFSTRANARRHERTLHPNLFELSTSTPHNTPITKPTADFAALLATHGNAGPLVPVPNSAAKLQQSAPLKFRQQAVNAFVKRESGGYDYDSPEKYQHLLTDEKIIFLQQNEEFLRQYQTMTCRCCNKFYTTYKNFMAHMRKKYATLPRNLCFNCLKLNDSKALFISHLKRRNCINLFKILHALMEKNGDFAAAVKATAASVPEKLRAKDLLVNKMYECKLCPKQFRLKLEFRTHVYDEHNEAQQKDAGPNGCSFCALEIDDPVERKRHYNNMECIVTLRCLTCEAKFDNHQKFIDHVYEKHLANIEETGTKHLNLSLPPLPMATSSADNSPGKKAIAGGASSADESRGSQSTALQKSQYHSRMPQACPICGQQYNNYNNVLRHMESKHPDQLPQTYKCVKCGNGYPRLSNLREHMMTVHGGDKTRQSGFEYIVNQDNVKGTTDANNSTSSAYTGRYDYVMKDLLSITNGGTTADDDNEAEYEQAAKKMRMESVSGHNTSTPGTASVAKECPICDAVFSNNIGLSNHMRSHTAGGSQSAQAAIAAARARTPNSLTITPTSTLSKHNPNQQAQLLATAQQQAVFKRSLDQAADRRFRRMRCRICQRRFSSKKSYRFHMLNDHQIRNVQFIKCKLCDAEFAYEKGLKVHMFKIHNTLLRDEMIVKQYECDVCSTFFRNEHHLMHHKRTAHGGNEAMLSAQDATDIDTNSADQQSGISTPVSVSGGGQADNSNNAGPLYWYQCKYCPSNFNTNKKLAIHINSHDEFDSNDYSCKDCGNVYSGRKSLWVHRYKKHPQIAEPSECVLCKKVFFDSQMLENHIPTCNRKPISATGAHLEGNQIYRHKTGDDEDDDNSNELEELTKMKIRLPEVACTICGQRFTDQELFSKHIQMHEQELYTDNPLASMFDTGPADPNQFYLDCVNDMGEYACDLCSKTFTQMTALKVHRKWHFRGDSKQNQTEGDGNSNSSNLHQQQYSNSQLSTQINHPHQLGLQAVGLMPNNRLSGGASSAALALSKAQKRKRELKCEYCPSTFISNNNLRRHLYELHKDEVTNLPKPPKIKIDDELHCRRCGLKFETKREWIEHKVADARVTKPFGPFQWGCDLCGEYVSRKEKLINHIQNHLKESIIVKVDATASTTTTSTSSKHRRLRHSSSNQQHENHKADDEIEMGATDRANTNEDAHNGEVEEDDDVENEDSANAANVDGQQSGGENDTDDNDNEDDEDGEEDDSDDEDDSNSDSDNSSQSDAEAENTDTAGNRLVPKLTIKRNPAPSNSNDDDEEVDDGDSNVEEDDGDDDGEHVGENDADDLIEEVGEDDIEYDVDGEHDNDTRSSLAADDDDDGDGGGEDDSKMQQKPRYSCDLCQVFFDSQQELQKHVKMHFLNPFPPGAVSLTEIKSRSVTKSNNSANNSDAALTVTSS